MSFRFQKLISKLRGRASPRLDRSYMLRGFSLKKIIPLWLDGFKTSWSSVKSSLLCDIWCSLGSPMIVSACHIYRETNSVADWVVSFVAKHSGDWSWNQDDRFLSLFSAYFLLIFWIALVPELCDRPLYKKKLFILSVVLPLFLARHEMLILISYTKKKKKNSSDKSMITFLILLKLEACIYSTPW